MSHNMYHGCPLMDREMIAVEALLQLQNCAQFDYREELYKNLNIGPSFREHPRDDSAETSGYSPTLAGHDSKDGASRTDLSTTNTTDQQSEEVSATISSAVEPGEATIGNNEQVPIGYGNTWISEDLRNKIYNYPSYTAATRALLRALFSRRVLATHSLSGKPSPAFKDRPVKKILEPKIIMDIIKEVETNFQGVDKKLIKTAITSACADEAKAYRRSNNKNKRTQKEPSTSSSSADECSHE